MTLESENRKTGTLFVTARYTPMDQLLMHETWPANLREASALPDKFEFFNDHLANEFKDVCSFGSLQCDMTSFFIPQMTKAYKTKSETQDLNQVFMIKIKIGTESNSIFLAAPDRIMDPGHLKFTANIDSITDKVYVEFYDVIDESAFDATTANSSDLSNLKLLSLKVFDVKDFAFDS